MFDTWTAAEQLRPRDPNVFQLDRPRLQGQNAAILDRLMKGPATNDELIRLSRKYTSRVSDLRKAGYRIRCHRGDGGLNTYVLEQ